VPRIRLADSDRAKYPGPEWVEVDLTDLYNEATGLVEQIETAWGLTPTEFLRDVRRNSIPALRALVWVARRKAGCVDDPRTFTPLVQAWSGITYEPTPAEQASVDADPPANRAQRRAAVKPKRSGKRNAAASVTSSTPTGSDSSDS
jgi:hypothetical protein